MNIGTGKVFTNINYKYYLMIRFNKTRQTFPSVIRVFALSATAAIIGSVERANSKERVRKVPGSSPVASYMQK